jgi:Leucine-rich repeat (LRR) protein
MKYRVLTVLILTMMLLIGNGDKKASAHWYDFNCYTITDISYTECLALKSFFVTTGGPSWYSMGNWFDSTIADNWAGVTVTSGSVTSITLSSNNLSGTLAISSDLHNLSSLILPNNNIGGGLPPFTGFDHLTVLILDSNEFISEIPPEFGNLSTTLQSLVLSHNHLTGWLPDTLATLTNIITLDLGFNHLCIPVGYPDSDNPLHAYLESKDPDWDETQNLNYCHLCYLPFLQK